MKISVLTTSLGRELYLKRLFKSFEINSNYLNYDVEYFLYLQGEISNDLKDYITSFGVKIEYGDRLSIGNVLNKYKSKITGDLFWKLDDDARLISSDFIGNIMELYKLQPNSGFSPYPVGLINNPGGVLSKNHSVIYSELYDVYYTLRQVHHLGGFCRIVPSKYIKLMTFTDAHNEDSECSMFLNKNNVPMFYLENNLIVEHQESTLGQLARKKQYDRI